MANKPTYEELEQRVEQLEKAESQRKRADDNLDDYCEKPLMPHQMMELIVRIDQKRIDAAARQEELNIED